MKNRIGTKNRRFEKRRHAEFYGVAPVGDTYQILKEGYLFLIPKS